MSNRRCVKVKPIFATFGVRQYPGKPYRGMWREFADEIILLHEGGMSAAEITRMLAPEADEYIRQTEFYGQFADLALRYGMVKSIIRRHYGVQMARRLYMVKHPSWRPRD